MVILGGLMAPAQTLGLRAQSTPVQPPAFYLQISCTRSTDTMPKALKPCTHSTAKLVAFIASPDVQKLQPFGYVQFHKTDTVITCVI
jgi:hypothetical protein